MSALRPVHMAHALCDGCQQRILTHGWRPGQGWAHESGCPDCARTMDDLAEQRGGEVALTLCPVRAGELTLEQYRAQIASHEAAHAVLGIGLAQLTPTSIEVPRDPINSPVDADDPNYAVRGVVRWGRVDSVPARGYAAALLAGWEASVRWLREHDLDTPARRVIAAYEASSDLAQAVELVEDDDIATARRDVQVQVNAFARSAVDSLAAELLRMGVMTGDQAREVIDRAGSAPDSEPAATPEPVPAAASTGGTNMSVEQIRAGIHDAAQQSQTTAAGLASVAGDLTAAQSRLVGLAGELSQTAELLASCAQGSQAEEIERAVAALRAVLDETDRLPAQILTATQAVEQLPAELQAATQAAEDYANRL